MLGLSALVVAVSCGALAWSSLRGRVADRPSPAARTVAEDDELAMDVAALRRQVRMLNGRLNRVDPPRAGTGDVQDAPGSTIAEGDGSSIVRNPGLTRSAVLAEYRRRRQVR